MKRSKSEKNSSGSSVVDDTFLLRRSSIGPLFDNSNYADIAQSHFMMAEAQIVSSITMQKFVK